MTHKKIFKLFAILLFALSLNASATRFVQGVLIEEQESKIDPIVKQDRKGATLVVYYESGRIATNSLYLSMSSSTKARIQKLSDDRETLDAAKTLVKSLKTKHANKVDDLSDAEIVSASETVLNTTAKDGAAGLAIGAALGAALAGLKPKTKPKAK